MNRHEALIAGLTTYNTGRPCAKGHTADRYASTGNCLECLRQSRLDAQRLRNSVRAARGPDSALFAYPLHPADHAAALAYCQALDLQRGREARAEPVATVAAASSAPPAYDADTAREIARRRAEAMGPAPTPRYMPKP
jgi:hypothetical protein